MAEEDTGQDAVEAAIAAADTSEAVPIEEVLPTRAPATEPAEPVKTEEPGEAKAERPRDPATGRFVSQDATVAEAQSGEQPPAETPAAAAAEPAEQLSPEGEIPEGWDQWSYTADGEPRSLEGSAVGEHGIFISNATLPWLTSQLSTAFAHNNSWQAELQRAQAQGEAALTKAEAREKAADTIVKKMQELAEGDPDAAYQWFEDYRINLPTLLAEAQTAQLVAEKEALESQVTSRNEEQQQADLQNQQKQAIDMLLAHYGQQYPNANVETIRNRLATMSSSIFYTATTDSPDGQTKRGDQMVNFGLVEDEFRIHQQLAGGGTVADQEKVTEAAKANVDAVAESPAPPVAPVSGTEPAAPSTPMPKFKTAEEMRDYMESPEADEWAAQKLKELG